MEEKMECLAESAKTLRADAKVYHEKSDELLSRADEVEEQIRLLQEMIDDGEPEDG